MWFGFAALGFFVVVVVFKQAESKETGNFNAEDLDSAPAFSADCLKNGRINNKKDHPIILWVCSQKEDVSGTSLLSRTN